MLYLPNMLCMDKNSLQNQKCLSKNDRGVVMETKYWNYHKRELLNDKLILCL